MPDTSKPVETDHVIEKLIELLSQVQDGGAIVIPAGQGDRIELVRNQKVADHLIANGVTVQQWIPVTERLPENDYGKHRKERKYYLVRLQCGQTRIARYGHKEYGWWIDSHDCVLSKGNYTEVTHWAEASKPPKGD